MELFYCTQCGKPLIYKEIGDEGEQKFCPDCHKFYFDNPACCILAAIINEKGQVLLLKQNYISKENYTLCSGYVQKKETLEEAVVREVLEETGQKVLSCQYVQSYYFTPKNLIMTGFLVHVNAADFGSSKEVDDLFWTDLDKAVNMVERENNYSGIHLDNCIALLKENDAANACVDCLNKN